MQWGDFRGMEIVFPTKAQNNMESLKCMAAAFKRALGLLERNDPLILCSSTAFFATFSLSPIILLLVTLFSVYFNSDNIGYQMFQVVGSTFGAETAKDIEKIVANFNEIDSTWLITIGSFVFFLFVGTTLLTIVKKAIHKLWHIRSKPEWHLRYFGWERGTAVVILLITGALILLSILVDTGLAVSLDYLETIWPGVAIIAIRILNVIFSIAVVTIWFAMLFKLLPEAKLNWEVAFVGGFFTGILFYLGQFLIGKLIVHARLASIFGATTSLAVVLLFIFYCSFILYFGAAFTYEYASKTDQRIRTNKHSRHFHETFDDE